ncbi:MAG TPA: hypothetical protein PLF66_15995 [Leptospiraceae bacterium]|nr:hypothetical protein [Leptospiraceae bacterium]
MKSRTIRKFRANKKRNKYVSIHSNRFKGRGDVMINTRITARIEEFVILKKIKLG